MKIELSQDMKKIIVPIVSGLAVAGLTWAGVTYLPKITKIQTASIVETIATPTPVPTTVLIFTSTPTPSPTAIPTSASTAAPTPKPTFVFVPSPTPTPFATLQPSPQIDPQIKIEKCKSEYTISKERMTTHFENYEFPFTELEIKQVFNTSYQKCVDDCINSIVASMGSHYPVSALSLCNSCKQNYSEALTGAIEASKNSSYSKIEQQLQQEYQQCLNQ